MKNSADSQLGFDKSAALAARFSFVAETGSTNDDMAVAARSNTDPAPDFSVIVTTSQTQGRGRLGRTWVATSGKTLAISVLVRPVALFGTPDVLSWLPLIAGVAMTRAVRAELARHAVAGEEPYAVEQPTASLKWPNDVQVDGFKVSGILTELLVDVDAVVIGAGLNLTLDEHDLPTLTSTSLQLVTGQAPDADEVLADYLRELRTLTGAFVAANGDAAQSGILAAVTELCGTLGLPVRIELPGGSELLGEAEAIDATGRLLVRDAEGTQHAIAAGDVTHLRLNS